MKLTMDPRTDSVLQRYGFESIPFEKLRQRLIDKGYNPDDARTDRPVSLADPSMLLTYPSLSDVDYDGYRTLGEQAIAAGKVAVVILNGGMATRFGGVPKGVVKVFADRSFLDLKVSQVQRVGGNRVPVVLMNSLATERVTEEHVAEVFGRDAVLAFSQFVSLRLTPSGEIFRTQDGQPSLHAPGHGDFPFAIKESGILKQLRDRGVEYLTLSNVDNLGAGLDPVIIGMHMARKCPMSVELVSVTPGDVGGFPAIVDDRLIIMEAFRLPAGFDTGAISVFNTNSFVFDAAVLDDAPELSFFSVMKTVEGKAAIQFERLVGQMTEFVDVTWMVVPRDGSNSRFIPIKTVEDISVRATELEERLSALGVV